MIRGENVFLRAIESGDVLAYHHWINEEVTNEWRGLHHPTSLEEAEKWIEEQRHTTHDKLSLTVVFEDVHVGFIGLKSICPRSRRAEVWIYIGSRSHWNRKVGQNAMRALCNYAFEEMNLERIWLECDPEFASATACYEHVGFKKEGLHKKGYYRRGKFRDTCTMALLRSEQVKEGHHD